MTQERIELADAMKIESYPAWVQDVVQACEGLRQRVTRHELYRQMHTNTIDAGVMRRFLMNVWPVIWEFPQYMGMSLCHVEQGTPGHEEARSYLIKNMKVENTHAQLWTYWAEAHGISLHELQRGERSAAAEALSHWCWHTCHREPLVVAMAATNYAIEGATGDWACYICSSTSYEDGLPREYRHRAMRWLKAHAHYDDKHPWQALAIITKVLGPSPGSVDIRAVQRAIEKSYDYMCLTQEECLNSAQHSTVGLERAVNQTEPWWRSS